MKINFFVLFFLFFSGCSVQLNTFKDQNIYVLYTFIRSELNPEEQEYVLSEIYCFYVDSLIESKKIKSYKQKNYGYLLEPEQKNCKLYEEVRKKILLKSNMDISNNSVYSKFLFSNGDKSDGYLYYDNFFQDLAETEINILLKIQGDLAMVKRAPKKLTNSCKKFSLCYYKNREKKYPFFVITKITKMEKYPENDAIRWYLQKANVDSIKVNFCNYLTK
jgi:hypothetical protein